MKCGMTAENITELSPNQIFVFGSNLAGIHGGGAAKFAHDKFGAVWGVGEGMTGDCYAIPTKDRNINTRNIQGIYASVIQFRLFVENNPDKHFLITKVGCGLAGFVIDEIAPLFRGFVEIENCSLPQEFIDFLETEKKFM